MGNSIRMCSVKLQISSCHIAQHISATSAHEENANACVDTSPGAGPSRSADEAGPSSGAGPSRGGPTTTTPADDKWVILDAVLMTPCVCTRCCISSAMAHLPRHRFDRWCHSACIAAVTFAPSLMCPSPAMQRHLRRLPGRPAVLRRAADADGCRL